MSHDGSTRPSSIEEAFARDDLDATVRFFSAARREAPDIAPPSPRRPGEVTPVIDMQRYRAARMRRRLLALLHALRTALDQRDAQGVWDVLDETDAGRCFPPGVRDEAIEIASLPHTSPRVPIRLLHYEHTLVQLGDEPMEPACDPAQLAIPLAPPGFGRRRS
jgi:hypothetical protein